MKQQKTYNFSHKMPPIAIKSSNFSRPTKGALRISTFMPKLQTRSMTKELSKKKEKKSEVFGQSTKKEELYEETILLKKTVNKLKLDLAEAKSEVVKTELNLRKKEKLIEDLTKENQTEESKNENKERGRESTLASLIQKNYKSLRNGYRILEDENKNLKADIKSTKIKESKIETDILIEEMQKIKKLYQHSQEMNSNYRKQIQELNEFKTQFFAQHKIIEQLQENEYKANNGLNEIKSQYDNLKTKLDQKEESLKKQKLLNQRLEYENKNYLKEKKDNEKYTMAYAEYQDILKDLKSKYEKSERDYKKCESDNNTLKKLIKKYEQLLKIPDNPISKEYNINNNKIYENKFSQIDVQKSELLNSLVKDLGIKCKIYEKYIKKNKANPNDVLKEGGYQGVIGNASDKIEEEQLKESKNENNKNENNKNENNKNENNINIDDNINVNDKELSQNNNTNEQPNQIDTITKKETNEDEYKSFEYILIKSLEANNTTKEKLLEELNECTNNETILNDITNVFNTHINNQNENNKEIILTKLTNKYEILNKDNNEFIEYIKSLINTIKNYLEEEENQKKQLNNFLLVELESLSQAFPKKEDNILNYSEFKSKFISIMKDIKEDQEQFDYLIYKMKNQLKADSSIYDLNINILSEILENLDEKDYKTIEEKIKDIKKVLEENNINNINEIFENNENLEKSKFIEILEKVGIEFKTKEKEELIKKYIITDTNEVNITQFKNDLNN